MYHRGDLTYKIHLLALCHFLSIEHIPLHALSLYLLVEIILLRYPEYKRKFYYEFCELDEATDFYILNYDEQVSIVAKQHKVFMIDEEKSAYYTFFINRYMTYILDENQVVRVSMYDYRDRISHIVKSNKD